jgi:hypothetical protein
MVSNGYDNLSPVMLCLLLGMSLTNLLKGINVVDNRFQLSGFNPVPD